MLAVIKTGGKQYLVQEKQRIKIEKLPQEEGKEVFFDQVLLVEKNKKLLIGAPLVKDAKVIGKVVKQGKAEKVIVFKFRRKSRYKKKKGHRQPFTQVEITRIDA
jgi:large subunit ribosomal protein L21